MRFPLDVRNLHRQLTHLRSIRPTSDSSGAAARVVTLYNVKTPDTREIRKDANGHWLNQLTMNVRDAGDVSDVRVSCTASSPESADSPTRRYADANVLDSRAYTSHAFPRPRHREPVFGTHLEPVTLTSFLRRRRRTWAVLLPLVHPGLHLTILHLPIHHTRQNEKNDAVDLPIPHATQALRRTKDRHGPNGTLAGPSAAFDLPTVRSSCAHCANCTYDFGTHLPRGCVISYKRPVFLDMF